LGAAQQKTSVTVEGFISSFFLATGRAGQAVVQESNFFLFLLSVSQLTLQTYTSNNPETERNHPGMLLQD